jgi:hypothetical protein
MAQVYFQEKISIPSGWRLIIFSLVTLMMGFVFLMTYLTEWDTMPDSEKPFLLTLLIGPVLVLVFFFIRLDLRLTQKAIEYKLYPFRKKFKTIPYSETVEIELLQNKGFASKNSFGVNKRINRLEYNFGGHYLLSIKMKNGSQISISTFKPKELEYFLRNLPEEVPVVRKDRYS